MPERTKDFGSEKINSDLEIELKSGASTSNKAILNFKPLLTCPILYYGILLGPYNTRISLFPQLS